MTDARFFNRSGPFTLEELAEISGGVLQDQSAGNIKVVDVAPLHKAGKDEVSFLDNRKYVSAFESCTAGACVVHPDFSDKAPDGVALILSTDPYRSYAKIAHAFYPQAKKDSMISDCASVHETAVIGKNVLIEAGAVICEGVVIGDRSQICSNAVIRNGVVIGNDCFIGSNVTLSHSIIGDNVIIHPGAAIGQDGFGFSMGPKGHLKVPQLGRVIIHNDVEIGSNTTIDRGAGPDTIIGEGTRIDNLVQIAHNVEVGRGCVIVSQVGISGSTHLSDFVVVGGQTGIAGHLTIGAGVQIGAQAGVMRDVPAGQTMVGSPAMPAKDFWRKFSSLERLSKKSKS